MFIIFALSIKDEQLIKTTMNENLKNLLKTAYSELTQVELKLKVVSFLLKSGAAVNEGELDELLERRNNLKLLIEELEKQL